MLTKLSHFHLIRSFLWRTGIGSKFAKAYWKLKSKGNGVNILESKTIDIFENLPIDFSDKRYNDFLKNDLQSWRFQEEYIVEMTNVIVEPERGLGIQNGRYLLEQTIVYKNEGQFPYILDYFLNKSNAKTIEQAVLYDSSANRNYFHILIDALPSLYKFHQSTLKKDIPVIIGKEAFTNNFFQHVYNRSDFLKSINWYVQQPNEWLHVKKLIKTKYYPIWPKTFNFLKGLYNVKNYGNIPPFRKIFLNRDKKRFSRTLSNELEVIKLLEKYGFKTVFAEDLSVYEQEILFRETKYLIALTGMGLIQQLFMQPEHSHVLEIIPLNRLMPEYYCIGFALGLKYYDVLLGDSVTPILPDGSYKRFENLKEYPVDLNKLEFAIERMLNSEENYYTYGNVKLSTLEKDSNRL